MGRVENDLAWLIAIPHSGDMYNKTPQAEWLSFPVISVLVDHPDIGYVLFDTGQAPGNEKDRMPEDKRHMFPIYCEREDFVDARLASLGLSVDDISMIILSHTHFDHMGGLHFFQNTKAGKNVLVSRAEYAQGLVESHKSTSDLCYAYNRLDFDYEGIDYQFCDEDIELAPGLELIALEGHVPTILGMVLHLESGTYIFPSDALPLQANYGPPPMPGVLTGQIYDSLGFYRTVEKVKRLQKKYDATIIYPHDYNLFPGLKKAPEYYE